MFKKLTRSRSVNSTLAKIGQAVRGALVINDRKQFEKFMNLTGETNVFLTTDVLKFIHNSARFTYLPIATLFCPTGKQTKYII